MVTIEVPAVLIRIVGAGKYLECIDIEGAGEKGRLIEFDGARTEKLPDSKGVVGALDDTVAGAADRAETFRVRSLLIKRSGCIHSGMVTGQLKYLFDFYLQTFLEEPIIKTEDIVNACS